MSPYLDFFWVLFKIYTTSLSAIALYFGSKRFARHWKYRDLKKVWGIRDKDEVILLCSELDNSEVRQWVEPREFIYLMKYGDMDAYVEVITTLLRIYPNIDIKIMSASDLQRVHVDLTKHVVLIGGPDYNSVTRSLLKDKLTRIAYFSPHIGCSDPDNVDEIILYDRQTGRKFFKTETETEKDYGYFERIKNPYSPKHHVIFLGGCHTLGVTAAAKAFSAFTGGRRDFSQAVARNAKTLRKMISEGSPFATVFEAQKVGVNVNTPELKPEDILVEIAKPKMSQLLSWLPKTSL